MTLQLLLEVVVPAVRLVELQAAFPQMLKARRTGCGPCGFGRVALEPVGLAEVQVIMLTLTRSGPAQGTSPNQTVMLPAVSSGKVPVRVRRVPPSVEPLVGLIDVRTGVRLGSNVKVTPENVCTGAPCMHGRQQGEHGHVQFTTAAQKQCQPTRRSRAVLLAAAVRVEMHY